MRGCGPSHQSSKSPYFMMNDGIVPLLMKFKLGNHTKGNVLFLSHLQMSSLMRKTKICV